MEVSEINTRRFDVALELLREGSSFTFEGVRFWIAPDGSLHLSVDSSWHIENINKQTASSDVERAKDVSLTLFAKALPSQVSLRIVLSVSALAMIVGKAVWN